MKTNPLTSVVLVFMMLLSTPDVPDCLLYRTIWEVWKRAGTLIKCWAGDWMKHLFITVDHGLTDQMDSW